MLVVACSTTGGATTTATLSTTTTAAIATTTGPGSVEVDMGDLNGWETMTIQVGDDGMVVAIADDPGERAQGLMGVDDLGDLNGMLFVFPAQTTGGFWMKDTLIPLDIAFFDDGGSLVEVLTMDPCPADPCPSYVASGPFSWALEAPAGRLGALDSDATLSAAG